MREVNLRIPKPTSGHQERQAKVVTRRQSSSRAGDSSNLTVQRSVPGWFSRRSGRSRSGGPGSSSREAKFAGSGGRQIPVLFLLRNVSFRSRFGSQKAPGRFGPFSGPSGGHPGRDVSGTSKRDSQFNLWTRERRHEEDEEEEEEDDDDEEEEEEEDDEGEHHDDAHRLQHRHDQGDDDDHARDRDDQSDDDDDDDGDGDDHSDDDDDKDVARP